MDHDADPIVSVNAWPRWWFDRWIALCLASLLTSFTLSNLGRWYSAGPVLRWQCVILSLFDHGGTPIASDDIDPIQAKIGLEYLARESVRFGSTNATIVFRGPQNPLYQRGLQVCFLSFIRPGEPGQKTPPVCLSSVSFVRSNLRITASRPGTFRSGRWNAAAMEQQDPGDGERTAFVRSWLGGG